MLEIMKLLLNVHLPAFEPLLKIRITVNNRLTNLLHFPIGLRFKLLHLHNKGKVIQSLSIRGNLFTQFIPTNLKIMHDVGRSDEHE